MLVFLGIIDLGILNKTALPFTVIPLAVNMICFEKRLFNDSFGYYL